MAISCEQPKCQRSERDLNNEEEIQYFCTKCDMELCSICLFEHRSGYSLSKLKCDNMICYGTREENQ